MRHFPAVMIAAAAGLALAGAAPMPSAGADPMPASTSRAVGEPPGHEVIAWSRFVDLDFSAPGLVNEVNVAVMPVLLGGGVPLVPAGSRAKLRLTASKFYKSGIVSLDYAVERPDE